LLYGRQLSIVVPKKLVFQSANSSLVFCLLATD
jgi:hypothetical protein